MSAKVFLAVAALFASRAMAVQTWAELHANCTGLEVDAFHEVAAGAKPFAGPTAIYAILDGASCVYTDATSEGSWAAKYPEEFGEFAASTAGVSARGEPAAAFGKRAECGQACGGYNGVGCATCKCVYDHNNCYGSYCVDFFKCR
jgi:hypothetical protein